MLLFKDFVKYNLYNIKMKNIKIMAIGGLALVVVVGFAVAFGGNYFQGSIYKLSPTKTTLPKVVNVDKLQLKLIQPMISKKATDEMIFNGIADLAVFDLSPSSGSFALNQLHFDINSTGVSSLSDCSLYSGGVLVSKATTNTLSEANFDNMNFTVDGAKSMSMRCYVTLQSGTDQKVLATSLMSVPDVVTWSVGNTQYAGKGTSVVNASINWQRN